MAYQDSTIRKQHTRPPTKEGNTGERIDTNTYVVNTSTLGPDARNGSRYIKIIWLTHA